jgi:hypothetical protein
LTSGSRRFPQKTIFNSQSAASGGAIASMAGVHHSRRPHGAHQYSVAVFKRFEDSLLFENRIRKDNLTLRSAVS